MIEILNAPRFPRARAAGALVADILQELRRRAVPGVNLLELDAVAESMIMQAGGVSCYVDYEPSFGRGPFGHYVCTSVNDAVLHGLPHDRVLADGDLLSLDLAVQLDGVVADSAITTVVGTGSTPEKEKLIEVTQRALAAAIAVAGPTARIGDLAHAIGTVLTDEGYRSTPTSVATASARPCTRTRTCRTSVGRVAATSCVRGSCSRSSRG
ncbi:M24 family metallopeptidase [Nocardioides daphniae]|uniref:M24 family metallopeptidase n=1 Tax=Nocardioides daphniae TaxID=402297 RepID=UPI00268D5DF8